MNNIYKKIKNTMLILTAALFFITACSTSKPDISYGFMQLVLYQGDAGTEEYFTFFIVGEDEDGSENLDELYLYHDKEQLRWKLTSNDWISYVQDGRTWIGTRSIAAHSGLKLPRGVFRAVLVNKGGERGEREFIFDANARYPFPQFDVNNEMYNIKSQWPSNHLLCFDRSGNYTSTVELTSLSGSISQLNLPNTVRSVALWAQDEVYFTSALTNVVTIR